jgi:HD-GYP domain-containing protein (c-di-GMP phosphodiesterase class II)
MFVAVQLPREITEHEVNLLATLAGIAGDAIHRARLRESLESTYEMTLGGWARALDIRVKEGEGHNQRVAEMAWKLAYAMGIGKDELVHIRRGAILHDIGKLVLPDNVLLKDGPLSQEEWKIMLQHPEFGRDLLNPVEYLKPALDIPYCHHEKWDGTGYPRGLQGEEIPLAARIFAIVDVWDTMMLDRTYRSKFLPEKAIQYIREQAGKHFDPEVVRMFLKLINGDQRRP